MRFHPLRWTWTSPRSSWQFPKNELSFQSDRQFYNLNFSTSFYCIFVLNFFFLSHQNLIWLNRFEQTQFGRLNANDTHNDTLLLIGVSKAVRNEHHAIVDEKSNEYTGRDDFGVRGFVLVQIPRPSYAKEPSLITRTVQNNDDKVEHLKSQTISLPEWKPTWNTFMSVRNAHAFFIIVFVNTRPLIWRPDNFMIHLWKLIPNELLHAFLTRYRYFYTIENLRKTSFFSFAFSNIL